MLTMILKGAEHYVPHPIMCNIHSVLIRIY